MSVWSEVLKRMLFGRGGGGGGSGVEAILQEKTVTPSPASQTVVPDEGYNGLSSVLVEAIPDVYNDTSGVTAAAADVLLNKVIVNADGEAITGSMPNNGAVSQTLTTDDTSYTVPAGYHDGKGKVSISPESKSVTPTKSAQTITPSTGKVLSSVSVAAIPAAYQDVSDVTATAADVLNGKVFVDASGAKITGTMAAAEEVSF